MSRLPDPADAHAIQRRGFKLLCLSGGAALGVLVVALATPDGDAVSERQWMLDGAAPAVARGAASAPASGPAALDAGVDWGAVEASEGHGPAAIAAYER